MLKLRNWKRGDVWAGDAECEKLVGGDLFALHVSDDFGFACEFRVIFCELPYPEPDGTICVLAVMRDDERLTDIAMAILRGRASIAKERLLSDPNCQ
jgi:hypothetical protein